MNILERLQLRLTDNGVAPDVDVLDDCIETAKNAILSRRYPFGDYPTRKVTRQVNGQSVTTEETYVEGRYLDLQFRIALDLYNKIGAEGETQHVSNGINRIYESSWISNQLLLEVIPKYGGIT